jgi:hypothetical protein
LRTKRPLVARSRSSRVVMVNGGPPGIREGVRGVCYGPGLADGRP